MSANQMDMEKKVEAVAAASASKSNLSSSMAEVSTSSSSTPPAAIVRESAEVEASPMVVAEAVEVEVEAGPIQTNRRRCFTCNKKVGYTGIECKCKLVFCGTHRYPDQHSCSFDFKTDDRKNLERHLTGGGEFAKVDRL
jgi:hypothetical protein